MPLLLILCHAFMMLMPAAIIICYHDAYFTRRQLHGPPPSPLPSSFRLRLLIRLMPPGFSLLAMLRLLLMPLIFAFCCYYAADTAHVTLRFNACSICRMPCCHVILLRHARYAMMLPRFAMPLYATPCLFFFIDARFDTLMLMLLPARRDA